MLPQQALKTNGNSAPHKTKKRILCRSQAPVVNTPPDTRAISKEKKTSSFRNFHFAQAEGKYPESPPPGGASHRSCGCAVAKRLHGRGGAGGVPGGFFHTLSRGQDLPPANRPHPKHPSPPPHKTKKLPPPVRWASGESCYNPPHERKNPPGHRRQLWRFGEFEKITEKLLHCAAMRV